jgi:hypothetical protein
MDLTGIATVVLAVVTLVSVGVAIVGFKHASADAKAARIAELSWNVYQAYDSPDLREGRMALNTVSRKKPVPASGEEFGEMYVTRSYKGAHREEASSGSIRKMLRFYSLVGVPWIRG